MAGIRSWSIYACPGKFDDVDVDPIRNKVVISCPRFLLYKSIETNFNAQGHVTLKGIVRSGLKWNLSRNVCLSFFLQV